MHRADEIVGKFHENLEKTTASKNLPFAIEASVGYVIARDASKGIDEYINDADDKMYQEKRSGRRREPLKYLVYR